MPGDHVCAGCSDRWNRGPWDDDGPDWDHTRPGPADRCGAGPACVECGMTAGEMTAAEWWANVEPGAGVCCEVPLTPDGS